MKIWLVGRTNVGKSTLFNRLLWSYRAIVTDISGTTRELLREESVLGHKDILLIDSPGLENVEEEMQFIQEIIQECDILLFVIDGKADLWEQEYRIREMILENGKKDQTILVANKLDDKVYHGKADIFLSEFYSLGFGYITPISAEQQQWLEQLVRTITAMPHRKDTPAHISEHSIDIPLAILWRPNVGKSTLLNRLMGEELSYVQDEPGTTLDYITAHFERDGQSIALYDTAGIRKKKKIVWLERIAYAKTMSMLDHIRPVVVFVLDVVEWLTHRDKSILGEIIKMWLPLIIAINKIDMMEPKDVDHAIDAMRLDLWFRWIPYVRISGLEWYGLPKILQNVTKVYNSATTRVPTSGLNKLLYQARVTTPPRFPKNKICKRKYISQVEDNPPTFNLSVNNKQYANFSFQQRVENIIRKEYGFEWVPIKFTFTNKVEKNPYLQKNK